ncbi:threonine ammonia-lyase [Effusibacillus lacus]|uniref:L-threonine dehydratase catabolic TdcB n=1 Tax=Effusibacillus lacus TaxID=1348429 RepID=A0A292YMB5_9BACL|nr:threonine ammonia-lyase [Effusibacillus lacus]TCS70095.1 threonine dehydratase [Effusibacillus lacus]GAX91068.1 threonine ammonia-lyase [Effusibacillus lacus]
MLQIRDFASAAKALDSVIHRTPLEYSTTFSRMTDNDIYLKLENLQKTGSFKIRGAYNKIATLTPEERQRGVIAASAGNHAQGVAYAANSYGIPCTIVMPEGAPLTKVEATASYGAKIVLHGANYDAAYQYAQQLQEANGMTFVHAFDDPAVVAGQGTIALEMLEQLPDVDVIVTPIGGGGLAAGVALAAKLLKPDIHLIGVEASGAASMFASLRAGQVQTLDYAETIADGILVKRPGELTFDLVRQYVDDVIMVDDDKITKAMLLLMERSKLVVEGSGAVGLAAFLDRQVSIRGKKVAIILSGGNVDVNLLSKIIERGLVEAGRYLRLVTTVPDRPGVLLTMAKIFAEEKSNVISIHHHRMGERIILGQAEVEVNLETRDRKHIERILNRLSDAGFTYTIR